MSKRPVFIDANIIMYTVGAEHPLKKPSQTIVQKIIHEEIQAVTDAEVFQEILYRYWSQGKRKEAISTYQDFKVLLSVIYPITLDEMDLAKDLLLKYPHLTPRDAIHVAVMWNQGIHDIYSADRHFDGISKIKRLGP